MSVADTPKSGYILGYDERELSRLDEQAAVWEPATRRALTSVGIARGARCLDVGCGTGSVMRIIAELVGETGQVVGADSHAELGRSTVTRLNAAGPAIFAFQTLDITTADSVAGAPYDLVFARLLLCHMTDPVDILRRMWSWVAPGGTLLVQDYDQTVACAIPEQDVVRDGIGFITGAFTATGKSPRIGTEIPGLFFASGIGAPDGIDVHGHIVPGKIGCAMMAGVMRSLAPVIIDQQIAEPERFDATLNAVDALTNETNVLARIPDMVATWKRKEG